MDQPDLDNRTDFVVHPQLLADRDGEKLAIVVKATFEVQQDGALELAPPDRARGVRLADVPWEKEKPESLAYPADLCLRMPGTSVVLAAKAYAPGGRAAPRIDVRVEVGRLSKSLAVFGRRLWVEGGEGLTEPTPIEELALRYDLAWGGRDDRDPQKVVEEARNPVGMGVTRDAASLTHKAAPHIEDPAFPIRTARGTQHPAGVGPIGRSWEPRRRYAGTYDADWLELKAPLLPDDFDDRYNVCASAGLHAEAPLVGGESVRLLNLMPGGGALSFTLPKVSLEIEVGVKGKEPLVFTPHLDTVFFDLLLVPPGVPAVVELIWRAHTRPPRKMRDARVLVRERVLS